MQRVNLLTDDWSSESTEAGYRWRRMRIAGENVGASLYELAPGQKTWPYHYELGNDELLVVVAGRPTLRDPDGEHVLEPGDCVLFPSGPTGAHQVINRTDEPARVLVVSNFALPRAAIQVDSGKLIFRWGAAFEDRLIIRYGEPVDYWEGEERVG